MKARLIHTLLEKNQVPTHWTYPQAGTFEGAQVIEAHEALHITLNGDSQDDWYSDTKYSHIAFFDVDTCSGDSGPLTYRAIRESDVKEMKVIAISDLNDILLDVAEELDTDEAWDEMQMFPNAEFIIEEHIDMVIHKAESVQPQFINTL